MLYVVYTSCSIENVFECFDAGISICNIQQQPKKLMLYIYHACFKNDCVHDDFLFHNIVTGKPYWLKIDLILSERFPFLHWIDCSSAVMSVLRTYITHCTGRSFCILQSWERTLCRTAETVLQVIRIQKEISEAFWPRL